MWWLLLITLNLDHTISSKLIESFDYKPSCLMAAEARQLYKTADYIDNQVFICIGEHEGANE